MTVLVVTGTGTGVGKTIATAALAAAAVQSGIGVAVCKPVQTGTAAGDDDLGSAVGRAEHEMREAAYPIMRMTLEHDERFGGGGLKKLAVAS